MSQIVCTLWFDIEVGFGIFVFLSKKQQQKEWGATDCVCLFLCGCQRLSFVLYLIGHFVYSNSILLV